MYAIRSYYAYGNIYVAQVNSRANQKQVAQALKEAEEYDGPSLVIAYSPCIAHGIQGGLMKSVDQGVITSYSIHYTKLYERRGPRRIILHP